MEIIERLKQIEGIKLLYVCEAGSRAYGLHNEESDYNIRFIYSMPLHSYLNLFGQKEEMEIQEEHFDIVGWDIKKVLRTVSKSQTNLYEWLASPVVYYEDSGFLSIRKCLLEKGFSLRTLALHYISMARNNYKKIINRENIGVKSCLWVLKPLLMAKWILEKNELPPVNYKDLIQLRTSIKNKLEKLLVLRKNNIRQVPFTRDLEYFIEQEMDLGMKKIISLEENERLTEDSLNQMFIQMVSSGWNRMEQQVPEMGKDVILLMKSISNNQYYYAKAYVLGSGRFTINGKVFVQNIITNSYEPVAWLYIEEPSKDFMDSVFVKEK